MPCPPSVPISVIPPVAQGVGPLVWANGSQVARLTVPLNPSWLVYDGSVTRWGDGSAQAPVLLPALQEVDANLIEYNIGTLASGQLAKTAGLPTTIANDLAGGLAGQLAIQTAPNATSFIYPNDVTVTATSSTTDRTLSNRFSDVVNVKDFGAVGNGTTDDRASILNAFNSSNSKRIYFPAGTYLIATPLSAPNGSRAYMEAGSSFITNSPTNVDFVWEKYNTTPIAQSVMQIDKLIENNSFPLKNEASIWLNNTYTYFGISKEMTATTVPNISYYDSPATNTFVYTSNSGVLASAVGLLCDVVGTVNNTVNFCANFISRNQPGTTNTKLVGLEIDVEPSSSTTVSAGTAGLYLNAFNVNGCGPAVQTGGIGGGTFSNGFVARGIKSDGAAFADGSGLNCQYGLALTNGNYSFAAIALDVNKKIKFWGSSITLTSNLYQDPQDDFHIELTKKALIDANISEGEIIAAFRNGALTSSLQVLAASTTGWNAAKAALFVAKNSSTNRSINASGTINASGADYAEYETKNISCGTVEKGQIIGFDVNGKITDQWDQSISFGVKSTDPNIVGGDNWDNIVSKKPIAPDLPKAVKDKPTKDSTIRSEYNNQIEDDYQKSLSEWEKDCARYESEIAIYTQNKAEYDVAYANWEEEFEKVRQTVDRISYCGKVPVNIYGSNVGDYIIPNKNGDGIIGIAISSPSFEQYQIAVGRVRRILPDGRAEIVVKPI